MVIMITGGSGFIGSSLAEHFKLLNPLVPTHLELDLTDEYAVREYILKHKPDYIVHCANVGKYGEYVPDATERNIRMEVNLKRMGDYYKKLIVIGSGASYEKKRSLNMIKESDFGEYIPLDQYGFAKYLLASSTNHSSTVTLQLFGVYGESEGLNRFISNAIYQVLQDQPIIIYKNAYFDYMHVEDLAYIVGILFHYKKAFPRTLNVGTGMPVDLLSIARKIKKLARSNRPIVIEETGLANAYTCNNDLLRSILPKDFKFTSIDEGIKRMYDYYSMEGKN